MMKSLPVFAVPVLLALFPVLGVYSHMGFSALAVVLALVLGVSFGGRAFWDSALACRGVMVCILAILGWGLVTAPWALNSDYAVSQALKLLIIVPLIPALFLVRLVEGKTRHRMAWILGIGFGVGLGILAIEGHSCYESYIMPAMLNPAYPCGWLITTDKVHHFNNNFLIFTLLSPIAGGILAGRFVSVMGKVFACGLVQVLVGGVIAFGAVNASSILLFIVGNMVFLGAWILPRVIRYCMVVVAVIFSVGLIPASHYIVDNYGDALTHTLPNATSEKMRIEIWDYAGDVIAENPKNIAMGVGFKNGRFVPDSDVPFLSVLSDPHIKDPADHPVGIYNHPHNMFIEILLDLGVVGSVLALVFIGVLARCIGQAPLYLQPYYLAVMVGSFAVYNVGLSVWRSWWIAFIIMLIAVVPLLVKDDKTKI